MRLIGTLMVWAGIGSWGLSLLAFVLSVVESSSKTAAAQDAAGALGLSWLFFGFAGIPLVVLGCLVRMAFRKRESAPSLTA